MQNGMIVLGLSIGSLSMLMHQACSSIAVASANAEHSVTYLPSSSSYALCAARNAATASKAPSLITLACASRALSHAMLEILQR